MRVKGSWPAENWEGGEESFFIGQNSCTAVKDEQLFSRWPFTVSQVKPYFFE